MMKTRKICSAFLAIAIAVSALVCPASTGNDNNLGVDSVVQTIEVSAADTKIEAAINWAVGIANDNSHGYTQVMELRQGPDYDCSSLVINALKNAGINTGGASYTGNMKSELTKYGFTWISWSEIGGVSNLQRGDILFKTGHTEIYLGNGQNVGAHDDRGYPQTGDQTGTEINVSSSNNSKRGWTGVLRYKAGSVTTKATTAATAAPGCFKKYTGSSGSIVNALKAIGADSSYNYRKKIAAANGISNYSGTASQNTTLLKKLKAGTLKKPGSVVTTTTTVKYFKKYTGSSGSIVNALKAIGADSSYSYRKKIAQANGISNYSGTASQNTTLLKKLKNGTLKKP
jgi:hypothetical protein